VSELDLIALDFIELRLKVIALAEQFRRIADVGVSLMKNIHPVVKVVDPGLLD
jgi:hypothetical protein